MSEIERAIGGLERAVNDMSSAIERMTKVSDDHAVEDRERERENAAKFASKEALDELRRVVYRSIGIGVAVLLSITGFMAAAHFNEINRAAHEKPSVTVPHVDLHRP